VLPGTGGLTRVTDKRHVRRDRADLFATRPDGVQGQQALEWGLIDHLAPRSRFDEVVAELARARAAGSDRPVGAAGIELGPLGRRSTPDGLAYGHVEVGLDRDLGAASIVVRAPSPGEVPADLGALVAAGDRSWSLAAARELDDALLHLRFNEPEIGTWVLTTEGDPHTVLAADEVVSANPDHWLAREIRLLWRRVLSRLDLSARTLVAAIGAGSCFAGTLAELALAADRSFMLDGTMEGDQRPPPVLVLGDVSLGGYEMANGLTRLATRFWGDEAGLAAAMSAVGKELVAVEAEALGLVTFAHDDLDWEDELRLCLEERASFSPDALTGLEANLRFAGPETTATKIFGRLTAWQNWIFQRPNAAGPDGALRRFGSGTRPSYDRTRN
jgi:benzoyl-CoA-dihydrodiol lyase